MMNINVINFSERADLNLLENVERLLVENQVGDINLSICKIFNLNALYDVKMSEHSRINLIIISPPEKWISSRLKESEDINIYIDLWKYKADSILTFLSSGTSRNIVIEFDVLFQNCEELLMHVQKYSNSKNIPSRTNFKSLMAMNILKLITIIKSTILLIDRGELNARYLGLCGYVGDIRNQNNSTIYERLTHYISEVENIYKCEKNIKKNYNNDYLNMREPHSINPLEQNAEEKIKDILYDSVILT